MRFRGSRTLDWQPIEGSLMTGLLTHSAVHFRILCVIFRTADYDDTRSSKNRISFD